MSEFDDSPGVPVATHSRLNFRVDEFDSRSQEIVDEELRESRILYVTHRVPFPPDKGRSHPQLSHPPPHGETRADWLACLADEPVSDETRKELNRLCERVAIVSVSRRRRWIRAGLSLARGGSLSEGAFFEPELMRVIDGWASEVSFAATVASASSVGAYLQSQALGNVPAIIDFVDVDSQKWLDYARSKRFPKSLLYRIEAHRVRCLEARLTKVARAVAVVSRAEADILDAFAGEGATTVAPNGVDLDYFHPQNHSHIGGIRTCVFVGALDYLPNIDAVKWFTSEVWPLVRQRFPNAEFHIVGRQPTAEVRRLGEIPGVRVIGQVADIRPAVAAADVVVVPLRLARGIQNKVLEALAMGKAVIASPPALAALKAEPGRHLVAASSPDEWIESIEKLFTNPDICKSLGHAGREFVEENHHWEKCLTPLLEKIFAPNMDNLGMPTAVRHRHP